MQYQQMPYYVIFPALKFNIKFDGVSLLKVCLEFNLLVLTLALSILHSFCLLTLVILAYFDYSV